MLDFWVNLAVTILVGVLQQTIKNPSSVKIEQNVILQIRDIATEAALAVDPLAPPPPGYQPIGGAPITAAEVAAAAPAAAPAPAAPAAPIPINKGAQTL